jgi:hypothetical protein
MDQEPQEELLLKSWESRHLPTLSDCMIDGAKDASEGVVFETSQGGVADVGRF